MYQSVGIPNGEGDSSAVGMDVFSTLFVIFVLITAVGTILMGAVNIPKDASYIRVFTKSTTIQDQPFCIGNAIPCSNLRNDAGDISALYRNLDQGQHVINLYVQDVVALKQIVDSDNSASIEILILRPLSQGSESLGVYNFGQLYEHHRRNPNSPIISKKYDLNYEEI